MLLGLRQPNHQPVWEFKHPTASSATPSLVSWCTDKPDGSLWGRKPPPCLGGHLSACLENRWISSLDTPTATIPRTTLKVVSTLL